MNPNYILIAIPFFFLSIIIEFIWGRFKKTDFYNFEDTITNLNIGIGNQAFSTLLKVLLLTIYGYIYNNIAPFKMENSVWSFILCFVVFDFIFYWAHRFGHEMNIFWAAHIVHHQSQEYNLSVALRQSWFHNALAFVLFLPIPFLGFDPLIFAAAAGFNTIYQYWIHTKYIKSLGVFEWLFNSPSHHRVHHATNPQYLDKNYGGTLIIWDRLFGTFQKEEETPVYGITVPLNSWNPVWANIHVFRDIINGWKKLKTFKSKFALPFKGPEYLGKLLGQKSDSNTAEKKFRTKVPLNMQIYVFFQFVVLTCGLVGYMNHFDELSTFYKLTMFTLIVLTTLNCGAIMENKKWVNIVEIVRFAAFLPLYNTLYLFNYKPFLWHTIVGSSILAFICLMWIAINQIYLAEKRNKTVA
jgi:sterol desaturase/sphingolipid hydroxylase (fatty acid hydroxylase superfamily)